MDSKGMIRWMFFGALAAAGVGCTSAQVVNKAGGPSAMADEFKGAPTWVTGSCAKYLKKDVICGVGSFGGTANPSIARSGAEARGRTDIARQINDEVRAAFHDYQATTTGGGDYGKAAADEQHAEDVSKNITDTELPGAALQESWISSSGTYYALMSLDLASFKDMVSRMKTLSDAVRQAVIQRADKAWHQLDVETGHASK